MDSQSENPNNDIIVSSSLHCTVNGDPEIYGTDDEEDPIPEETPITVDNCEIIPDLDLDSNDNENTAEVVEQRFCDFDELVEPKVGMIFDTAKEAFDYYNEYARKIGFRVRILRTNMNRSQRDEIHLQVLVCSCEGTYRMVRKPRKRRESKRFECMAVFEIKLMSGDKYALIRFKAEHTHELVPPKFSSYLKTPKRIESAHIAHVDSSPPRGIKADIFSYIPEELGLPDPYTNLELAYMIQKQLRNSKKVGASCYEYGLRGIKWLQGLYDLRQMWLKFIVVAIFVLA
ncbi:hypothetical protein MKX01_034692 [Papaver californicum]|nr:hypothetical protein MKX01_034692 [Papaver californicum]